MNKRRIRMQVCFAAVFLVLVLVMVYSGLRILESTVFRPEPVTQTEPHASKTITRGDIAYFPRQDITVILVMGIDEEGPVVSSNYHRNTGASDMVALLILDQTEECYRILCLNRDMMVRMPVLGLGGKYAGTVYAQLALSHTYGTGLEDSAENTRKTVSDLLYGIGIDYYVAMNIYGIGILNDAMGGVTVHVRDDFSQVDPTITKGKMLLNREQAITFVRSRKDVGTEMNLSRMDRQKEYMNGLADALKRKMEQSDTFAVDLYEQMDPYVVTDCAINTLSGLLQRCTDYELTEVLSVEGRNVLTGEYFEFYADEEAMDELILDLFYAPKK